VSIEDSSYSSKDAEQGQYMLFACLDVNLVLNECAEAMQALASSIKPFIY
jgi:hypothetical protein